MSESKKVDPGWNDPPMLNFDASQPPPKSRISNKRVPFPLGPSSTVQKSSLPSTINHPGKDSSNEMIPNMANMTFTNFRSVLNSEISKKVHEKVELMEEMWKSDKFSTSLKNDLYKLSNSIVQKDYESANKLHFEIHMKYPTHCKDWISALHLLYSDK